MKRSKNAGGRLCPSLSLVPRGLVSTCSLACCVSTPSCRPLQFPPGKPGAASLTCSPRRGTTRSAWTRPWATCGAWGARTTRSGEQPGGAGPRVRGGGGEGRSAGPPSCPAQAAPGCFPERGMARTSVQDTHLGGAGQGGPEAERVGRVPDGQPLLPPVRQCQGEEAGQVQERWVPPATHGHLRRRALPRHWGVTVGFTRAQEGVMGPEPAGRGWAGAPLHCEPWVRLSPACRSLEAVVLGMVRTRGHARSPRGRRHGCCGSDGGFLRGRTAHAKPRADLSVGEPAGGSLRPSWLGEPSPPPGPCTWEASLPQTPPLAPPPLLRDRASPEKHFRL